MIRFLTLAVLVLTWATTARAEDACAAEVARLCPMSRGDLQVLSCLRAHEAELSKACRGDVAAVQAKALEVGADCEPDVYKLCREVQPGEGRIAECLQVNQSKLSTSCQAAINRWRLLRMELTSACAGDVGRWCPMVPEGSGRIVTCLRDHEKDLTSDCRSALRKL